MLILSGKSGGKKATKKTLNETKPQTETRQNHAGFIQLEFKSQSNFNAKGMGKSENKWILQLLLEPGGAQTVLVQPHLRVWEQILPKPLVVTPLFHPVSDNRSHNMTNEAVDSALRAAH